MIYRTCCNEAQALSALRHMFLGLLALFGASAIAEVPTPRTGEMVLSLAQALTIAREENHRIAIGRARRAGAEGARLRSRQSFFPKAYSGCLSPAPGYVTARQHSDLRAKFSAGLCPARFRAR